MSERIKGATGDFYGDLYQLEGLTPNRYGVYLCDSDKGPIIGTDYADDTKVHNRSVEIGHTYFDSTDLYTLSTHFLSTALDSGNPRLTKIENFAAKSMIQERIKYVQKQILQGDFDSLYKAIWEFREDAFRKFNTKVNAVHEIKDNSVVSLSGDIYFVEKFELAKGQTVQYGKETLQIYSCLGLQVVAYPQKVKEPSSPIPLTKVRNRESLKALPKVLKGDKVFFGDTVVFSPLADYVRDLKSGDSSFAITPESKKMEVSFEDSNELKGITGVDFSSFVCFDGVLFKKGEVNYTRVLAKNLHTHLPVNQCTDCAIWVKQDAGVMFDSDFYCEECSKAFKKKCTMCKKDFFAVDPVFLNSKREEVVCYDCFRDDCYECTHHSEPVFHKVTDICRAETQIKQYSYSPTKTRFVGKSVYPFYLGVELEIHAIRPKEVADFVRRKFPGDFYFKSDGSIKDGGVEIISVPHTRESFLDLDVSIIQKEFKDYVKAEGCGGIHVHVDRKAFEDSQVKKILNFFWENKKFVAEIAGRQSDDYAKIRNPREFPGDDLPNLITSSSLRYSALNFCKKGTLEYRLFDSTLDYEKFQKNLDFVAALWLFGKSEDTKTSQSVFMDFLESHKTDFSHLVGFLNTTKGNK